MDQQPEFTPRISTFLNLVGIVLLLVFISSYLANTPHFGYLFSSLIVLTFGVLLRRRAKRADREGAAQSERFRTLRKLRGKGKDKKEKPKR